jgi:hypothetical protein
MDLSNLDYFLAAYLLGIARFWLAFQQFVVACVVWGCYSQEVARERGAGEES